MASSFGALLRAFRGRSGLSQNRLARMAGVDPAYVNRLERARADEASSPRRRVVVALARAMELGPIDTDRLLVSSGLCPEAIERLGTWEPSLSMVARVLADRSLSQDDLSDFRELIRIAASRWVR